MSRLPFNSSNIKSSIASALDETHPTGPEPEPAPGGYGVGGFGSGVPGDDDIGAAIGHNEAKLDLPKQPPPKFPPFDFTPQQQQGEPTLAQGQQRALTDAMLYGEGFTQQQAGADINTAYIPLGEVHMQGEDRMPGGMGNDIREARVVENDRLPFVNTTNSHMDFGVAIRCMERGLRVQRDGWNGKDMWIALSGLEGAREVQAVDLWSYQAKKHAIAQGGSAKVMPCIIMKTATGEILMGWLASQSDMLAKDWRIVQ